MVCNDFTWELRSRNIKGFSLKLICFFEKCYIHSSKYICLYCIKNLTSFHQWCKDKIRGNSISDEQPQSTSSIHGQKQVHEIRRKFTFCSKIFLFLHVSIYACTNDYYLRSTKCEVHDCVRKHVRYMKKIVPRFVILEALPRFVPSTLNGVSLSVHQKHTQDVSVLLIKTPSC